MFGWLHFPLKGVPWWTRPIFLGSSGPLTVKSASKKRRQRSQCGTGPKTGHYCLSVCGHWHSWKLCKEILLPEAYDLFSHNNLLSDPAPNKLPQYAKHEVVIKPYMHNFFQGKDKGMIQ